MALDLQTPIEFLKGVGPERAELLKAELQVFTVEDLLMHFPFRYVDKSRVHDIGAIRPPYSEIQVRGRLGRFQRIGQGRKQRTVADLTDGTGRLQLVWFKGGTWIAKQLKPGAEYLVYGKPNRYGSTISIAHPDIKAVTADGADTGLEPVYHSTEKLKKKFLDSRGLRKLMANAFARLERGDMPEILPFDLKDELRLIGRFDAFRRIHFPTSHDDVTRATFRLKFEELLIVQLALARQRVNRNVQHRGYVFDAPDDFLSRFRTERLPFRLTDAQERVLSEIQTDMRSGNQMNRLLQGDVGSGKTIVALLTMLMARDNGFQNALMAPTEILAQQHHQGLSELLDGFGVRVALLTGSVKGADRKNILTALRTGHLDILIGTHALLEDTVVFENLGLAVIDEQHRFGVAQRAKLWKKNERPPHVLVMTATPIPRTLAMTFYGDLETSVIDELPPGRKPVITAHRRDNARLKVFGFLRDEVAKGRQAYIVYPLIDESETLDYKHLMDGYESVQRAFPDFAISIVHGQMKPEDKEYEMQRFARGETQIMVATTVIEVGVNVPNASVMVIESAERFGLSQLHQLRGRVGRGADQSYCILMTGLKLSSEARDRMSIMCETNDGFRIAEADLRLRGPGDIMGTQQSGMLNLKLADLKSDHKLLALARQKAVAMLRADPFMNADELRWLKEHLNHTAALKVGWSRIS